MFFCLFVLCIYYFIWYILSADLYDHFVLFGHFASTSKHQLGWFVALCFANFFCYCVGFLSHSLIGCLMLECSHFAHIIFVNIYWNFLVSVGVERLSLRHSDVWRLLNQVKAQVAARGGVQLRQGSAGWSIVVKMPDWVSFTYLPTYVCRYFALKSF